MFPRHTPEICPGFRGVGDDIDGFARTKVHERSTLQRSSQHSTITIPSIRNFIQYIGGGERVIQGHRRSEREEEEDGAQAGNTYSFFAPNFFVKFRGLSQAQ